MLSFIADDRAGPITNMQNSGLRIVELLIEPVIIPNQRELRITLQRVEEKQMQLEE